ncbi:hypothetical protein [Streptomyces chartreusis]
MADCCGARRCNCTITAGPGVTVDGNCSAATSYVISATGPGGGGASLKASGCIDVAGILPDGP